MNRLYGYRVNMFTQGSSNRRLNSCSDHDGIGCVQPHIEKGECTMRRISIWLFACLAFGLYANAVEFNTDGNKEGWTSGNNLDSTEVKDGNLVVKIKAGKSDPFLSSPSGSWDADTITGIEFRIRFSVDITNMGGPAIYYFPASGQHGSFGYQILYPQEWNIVYIDFLSATQGGDSPKKWEGLINQYRIDFPDNIQEDYTVEIDWIRFVDDRIQTNNFEYGNLDPWKLEGKGTIDSYRVIGDQFFSEVTSVEVTGLGSDQYHSLSQDIGDGLKIAKGLQVSVVGAVKIPKDSWDANSTLWFRIREFDGTTENLSPATEVTVFDDWFEFQSALILKYDPSARKALSVQLYSKNPSGKKFYFDDIFVDVMTVPEKPIENAGWPVNAVKLAAGQKITIDGNVSAAEYKGAQALVMNANTVRGIQDPYFPQYNHNGQLVNAGMIAATSLDDFNATYYFMWDSEYFYAAVAAQDDNYSFVGPDPNGSDALQFVFAESPAIKETAQMYIPTLAAEGTDGNILAKNDFGGWITAEIMGLSEFVGKLDDQTSDWTIEVKIPWSAMKGDFTKDVFPPKLGDVVGFVVLCIDYDNGVLEFFSCNYPTFPWEGNGVERMYFIDQQTGLSQWSLF